MTYSFDQAAKLLHRSRRSIYNYIRYGKLQIVMIGDMKRITSESLVNMVNYNSIVLINEKALLELLEE